LSIPAPAAIVSRMLTWREKLDVAMRDRQLTQYRLAKETGLRQSRISLWLSGTGEPSLEEWGLLCRALDVPLSWFFAENDGPVPEYRTPEEQLLIRVARKVGIELIWELIARAAVDRGAGHADASVPPPRSPGPIPPIREITTRERDDAAADPESADRGTEADDPEADAGR
jgi:transcriptional regulator with XRE-family HTH domain